MTYTFRANQHQVQLWAVNEAVSAARLSFSRSLKELHSGLCKQVVIKVQLNDKKHNTAKELTGLKSSRLLFHISCHQTHESSETTSFVPNKALAEAYVSSLTKYNSQERRTLLLQLTNFRCFVSLKKRRSDLWSELFATLHLIFLRKERAEMRCKRGVDIEQLNWTANSSLCARERSFDGQSNEDTFIMFYYEWLRTLEVDWGAVWSIRPNRIFCIQLNSLARLKIFLSLTELDLFHFFTICNISISLSWSLRRRKKISFYTTFTIFRTCCN